MVDDFMIFSMYELKIPLNMTATAEIAYTWMFVKRWKISLRLRTITVHLVVLNKYHAFFVYDCLPAWLQGVLHLVCASRLIRPCGDTPDSPKRNVIKTWLLRIFTIR